MLLRKLRTFFILCVVAIFFGVGSFFFENQYFSKLLQTLVAITTIYLIFKILLETLISKKIRDTRSRYSFRKTIHIIFLVIAFIIILRIWIVNPQALLVAYGLVAAGVAISLQDLFRNFAGGIILFISGPYHVGHRIEVNGTHGDVIDIGMMYTTLLEIRGWVGGDQTTGRICTIPNGSILSGNVLNYTKDHGFIWDEFVLPITYDSNWRDAMKIITGILEEETKEYVKGAQKNLSKLDDKYYVSKRNVEAGVYLTLTDNWIQMSARYIVEVHERRIVQAAIMEKILIAFEGRTDIVIASTTLSVTSTAGEKTILSDT